MTPEIESSARILTPELVLHAVISPHGVDQSVMDADLPELTHELNPVGSSEPVLATSSHEWRMVREVTHVTVDVMPNWLLEPADVIALRNHERTQSA